MVAFYGSIILALVLNNWYPLVLLPASVLLVITLLLSGAQLRATDTSAVHRAWFRYLVASGIVVAAVIAYAQFGHK
jgi:hypothetical protein